MLPLQGHAVVICDKVKQSSSGSGNAVGSSHTSPPSNVTSKLGNSMQLLTQGHPSVILNYCKYVNFSLDKVLDVSIWIVSIFVYCLYCL